MMSAAPFDPRFPERKRPAHAVPCDYFGRSTIIFLSACTKARRPALANALVHRCLLRVWRDADRWLVGRYMVMPDHIHLFCAPGTIPPQPLEGWVRYWKSQVSRNLGCGEGQLWQTDFWDVQLRGGESYGLKWEYVRNNPVRAGLVAKSDAWPFQGEIHPLRWRE
jgi:putative transposase